MVGERDKFLRKRALSCPKSGLTLSGDQFIGKLYHSNRGFIPQAMDRWGAWGPLFERFMLGDHDAPAIMTYDHDITPNAVLMNERACSLNVPYGILNTANKRWMDAHPGTWFGNSYMDSSPKIWALGQLGLGFTKGQIFHSRGRGIFGLPAGQAPGQCPAHERKGGEGREKRKRGRRWRGKISLHC